MLSLFYKILFCLSLVCISDIGFAQEDTCRKSPSDASGVYIVGKIGIFNNETLAVFSPVIILNKTEQIGSGTLLIKSAHPQKINSTNATLNNLVIDNPSVVTLKGNLHINHSLTLKDVTFDISDGTLNLDPTATVTLINKGHLKYDNSVLGKKAIKHRAVLDTEFTYLNSDIHCCLAIEEDKLSANLSDTLFDKCVAVVHPPPELFIIVIVIVG